MKGLLSELPVSTSFVILYGSQLGQAKSIAEGLVDVASQNDFNTACFELNSIKDVNDLVKVNCPIVIIASTTGDGEPPENADKFWRKIRKKNLASGLLGPVKFTILGLGDTNYNNFCNCGKEINRRLSELGATTFYTPAWADDAVGLDLVIDDWIDNLWPTLENLLRPNSTSMAKNAINVPACPPVSLQLEWLNEAGGGGDAPDFGSQVNLKNPLAPYPLIDGDPQTVTITKARILTKSGALKTTLELTLKFKEKHFKLQPGDAINIVCPNSVTEVNQLLEKLQLTEKADKTVQLSVKSGAKGKIPVFLPATITVRDAFVYYLDIRSCPKKNFIRLLAEFTTDETEKSQLLTLSSRQGSSAFEETIRFASLSLLDILLTFPTCSPPLEALLEHLPRLAPRAYSISSSPLVTGESYFKIAFNIVAIPKENGRQYERLGVCTGWLYNQAKRLLENTDSLEEAMNALKIETGNNSAEEILIYLRKNQTFRLPEDTNVPVIMVGPGTGVAPFVGFIEHRQKLKEGGSPCGPMTLFFGCRHKNKDFLYQDELQDFEKNGILTSFYPVFSRDNPEAKVKYVQHRIEENQESLVKSLWDENGYIYVCGDARNMAKDVRETILKCVQSVKKCDEDEAKKLLAEMTVQKRFLQDVWT